VQEAGRNNALADWWLLSVTMSNWYYVLVPALPNPFLGRGIYRLAFVLCPAFLSLTDTLLMILLQLKPQEIQLCLDGHFVGGEKRESWTELDHGSESLVHE